MEDSILDIAEHVLGNWNLSEAALTASTHSTQPAPHSSSKASSASAEALADKMAAITTKKRKVIAPKTPKYCQGQSHTLTSLPEDVLRRIFDFLLTARNVKKTWLSPVSKVKFYRTSICDFQVAVMRTSKAMYAIANEVFLGNHFVLVTSDNAALRFTMNENRVQFWDREIDAFKNHRMHFQVSGQGFITTARHPSNNITTGQTSFLVCSEDLEDFVLVLRTYEAIVNVNQYRMSFQLNTKSMSGRPLPLKLQRRLLEPFMLVRGMRQTCSVSPPVESTLANRLKAATTPRVFWFRDRAREFYKIILHEMMVADEAFDAREINVAARLYDNAADVVQNTRVIRLKVSRAEDEVFWNNFHDLALRVRVMQAMSYLLHAQNEVRKAKDPEYFRKILHINLDTEAEYNKSKAGIMLYCGLLYAHLVATLALGETTDVHILLLRIRKMSTFDARYNSCVNIAKIWARDHTGQFNAVPYPKVVVEKLLAEVPPKALRHVPMAVPTISASIDRERYILKALGYQGDLLEEQIVQKEDYSMQYGREVARPFDKKMADKMVKAYQKDLARQKSKRQVPAVCIESPLEEK